MSSVPPSFQHPGSPPPRPELPEGVAPSAPPADVPPPAPPDDPRARLPAFPVWSPFAAMLATLLIALLGFVVISALVEAAGTSIDPGDPPTGVTIGGTFIQDIALVVTALLFAGAAGRPTPAMFGLRRVPVGSALAWAAVCFASFYALAFLWALAIGIDESDDLAEELGAKDSTLNLVVVAVLVTVVAPIAEEVFFRGFMFPALWRRLGMLPGALVTGAIFGVIHAGGTAPEFLVPLAVFGVLLCLLYRWTGSLLPCIALHALNNGLALGATLGWEWWQVVAMMVAAPAVVLALALPLAKPGAAGPARAQA